MLNGISSLWISEAISRGMNAFTLIIIARTLGAEIYGLLGYAGALTMYLMMTVQFGTDMVIIRELAKGGEKRHIETSATALRFIIFLFACITLILLAWASEGETLKKLFLANIAFVASAVFPWEAFYQSAEQFRSLSRGRIAISVLNAVVVVLIIREPSQAWYVPAIYGAVSLTVQIVMVFSMHSRFTPLRFAAVMPTVRFLVRESGYLWMSSFLLLWISNNGILLLQWFRSSQEAGFYTVAMKLFDLANAFIVPVAIVLYPQLVQVFQKGKNLRERGEVIVSGMRVSMMLALLFTGVVLLSSEEIITIGLGDSYYESSAILSVLIGALVFRSMSMFFANAAVAFGAQRLQLLVTTAMACVSVSLGYLLIDRYGAPGVACGFGVSFIVELLLYVIVMRTKVDLGPIMRQSLVITIIGTGSILFGLATGKLLDQGDLESPIALFAFLVVFLFAAFHYRIVTLKALKHM